VTSVHVYGAGPAGLMAAATLATAGLQVTIHDHMAAPARKFLLAGRGGLNLTHSEPLEPFLNRYGEARNYLEPAIRAFAPADLIAWCNGLGIETFVGSSGRVFPRSMKASPLLRAWLRRLDGLGVTLQTRSTWPGFGGRPQLLAFGGASWPHLGSDAAWVPAFAAAGVEVKQFKPSNGRFLVPWTEHFSSRFAGQPIKNVALRCGTFTARGEIMISKDGLEGGAIYALSRHLREAPDEVLHIDLRPDLSEDAVAMKLVNRNRKESRSNFLRKAFGFTPVAISLMREAKTESPKNVSLKHEGTAGLERAISSAGGVAWDEIDETLQLRKSPGVFVAGEMLDWEAPTGGYLLQACFATGVAAAKGLLASLK
jgi:predicted Rossmann fold flavoprotein